METNIQNLRKLNNMVSALIYKSVVFLMVTLRAFSGSLSAPVAGQNIYLHTDMFEDNYCSATPKDVGAFKYFCIHDYVSSIVNQYIDIFAVSDNIYGSTFYMYVCM